ncbi:hypothetical protein PVAND_016737 [Polypedilum vanderplanki]|uniref:Cytochrome P450 n=1 Tax=Polypedilum vanderplanki TaxID=319348 RepID=A0A9J6BGB0_POLVA|nr:hypothetical protein PVAND_016737 [Polypedilum vanderplanki]
MEIFFASIILFLIIEGIILIVKEFKRPQNFPPGPNWLLPFVGSSKYLKKLSQELGGQHKAFDYLSKKYNSPIFSIKLGRELVVVVRSYELIKEVHSREEFDGRPDNFFMRLRTMGTRLGITCTDGRLWQEQRSFVVRQLRNVGYGKSKMEEQIHVELNEILEIIRSSKDTPIWPGETNFIATSVINILWTFTTGAKIKRNDARLIKFLNLLQKRSKAFEISGGYLNQMPWLRFFAPEATGYNLVKNLNSEFYKFFMEVINEHLMTYSEDKSNEDLIYAYIKEMNEQKDKENSTFKIDQLVMVILDIFIAGASSTGITIDLALMSMLIYPEIQMKVQKEIDEILNEDSEMLKYFDKKKMPFTEAVLLEVQRFYSIVPISGPRRILKPTTLAGYNLPKDTTVLIGLETIHKDENHWKDPQNFRPERFLDEKNNICNTERLFPFGAGKRRCLGDQLAKSCLFTFFVEILKEFSLEKCESDLPSNDLLPGMLLSPKPYKILFRKRKN